jgi:hypothetical protein
MEFLIRPFRLFLLYPSEELDFPAHGVAGLIHEAVRWLNDLPCAGFDPL